MCCFTTDTLDDLCSSTRQCAVDLSTDGRFSSELQFSVGSAEGDLSSEIESSIFILESNKLKRFVISQSPSRLSHLENHINQLLSS